MRGCVSIAASVGNKVGKAMERRPFVLYTLIGDRSIGGQSMEGGSGIFGVHMKHIIYSNSVLALFSVEINEDDSNSYGSNEFGGRIVEDKLC